MEVLVEYDYLAQNIDELTISKGDRIRNVIRKEEGWYEGELITTGRRGLFPDNFVKPIKIQPPINISKTLPYPPPLVGKSPDDKKKNILNNTIGPIVTNLNNGAASAGGSVKLQQPAPPTTSPPPPPPNSIMGNMQQPSTQPTNPPLPIPKPPKQQTSNSSHVFKAKVLYSYVPVNEDELAIQENEIVEVIRLVEDGWYEGVFNGRQGVFPSNYVEKLNESFNSLNNISNESVNNSLLIENADINDVVGIGFGNIFSGKTIELKTKENFTSNSNKTTTTVTTNSNNQNSTKTTSSISPKPTIQTNSPDLDDKKNALLIENNKNLNYTTLKTIPQPLVTTITTNMNNLNRKKIKARVLYEYMPTQPDELKLMVGDTIYILDKNLEDDGWWRGESSTTGLIGVFPDNFVEEINDISPVNNGLIKKKINAPSSASSTNINMNSTSGNNIGIIGSNINSVDTIQTSLTSSTSSSSNSLSKLSGTAVNQNINANNLNNVTKANRKLHHQLVINSSNDDNNSKSQSDLSEDLDELTHSETNKLTHIIKTKQLNKRPPSFRSKKMELDKNDINDQTAKDLSGSIDKPIQNGVLLKEPISLNGSPQLNKKLQQNLKEISRQATPASPQFNQNPIKTNSPSNGTSSGVSLTNGFNSTQTLFEELALLKEEIESVKKNSTQLQNDYRLVQSELADLKKVHEEQMRKMQKRLSDLTVEIDDEKKTRLALEVELERLKKTINSY